MKCISSSLIHNLQGTSNDHQESVPLHRIHIKTKHVPLIQKVTESHEIVQELVSNCGYPLELSIKAVEATREKSIRAATEFIESLHDNEDSSKKFINQEYCRSDSSDYEDIDWDSKSPIVNYLDTTAEDKYLTVKELGNTLRILSSSFKENCKSKRMFPKNSLKKGYPNLLVVKPDEVFLTILQLYMESSEMPLPSPEEVFICTTSTSEEEVELFWRRAIYDPGYRRIFCLAHAEKLSGIVCDSALQSLSEFSQAQRDYQLVIIYADKDTSSQLVTKLQNYKRLFITEKNPDVYKDYLLKKFICEDSSSAAFADYEHSCIRVVNSQRSAMGKSLYVKRLGERLEQKRLGSMDSNVVTIPLHGPKVDNDILMKLLEGHMNRSSTSIYHIDIAPSVISEVSTILFNLLVLRGISDSCGKVWRCHPNQLYVIEVTVPKCNAESSQSTDPFVLFISMLPSISCLKPVEVLHKASIINSNELGMDRKVFESDSYQRVFQYLQCHTCGKNLDNFLSQGIEESPLEFLKYILSFCGIKDPSWAEICHFVTFLDLQLKSCENSIFTNPEYVGDVLKGFKGFVVKFMIKMSRDFSTSSLKGEVAIENSEDLKDEDNLSVYQIHERKKWEQSPHPYILFNKDENSFTFVGFVMKVSGHFCDLINPFDKQILEKSMISKSLHEGLKTNRVNLEDDCRLWKKSDMIIKLSTVMGLDYPFDPDETYVLTVDNVIKILAILMRFRCGIPVVVMGETGCGKTRLIRYMCDLARQDKDATNMLIMKVHGGKTEDDIKKFIEVATTKAEENKEEGLDTYVFFDEANTTDALDLIKEILCDHRIKGVPIRSDLKFIAACNPYRKHNKEMITRLENAGLGYFVKDSESQKLGKIPLRQLVYRVLDLPPSMRPLVYDFGQLKTETEVGYIDQIVKNHMRNSTSLSSHTDFESSISNALKKAQAYMRKEEDECSFVSLRDVDRAMIVFEFFFDKMHLFGPRMEKWAEKHLVSDSVNGILDHNEPSQCITRALILSISMCYRARLQKRDTFDIEICSCFVNPILLPNGEDQFRAEIRCCEEVLLDSMRLGDNIARNAALRENVFMMAICIELKIPLFLVGKPGSSKSLAKAIVSDSMRGKDSNSELLKDFNEVQILSYQCSQLSTSGSIIKLFKDAKKYQDSEKQNKKSFVAVVVLDEVGLAEDSPNLPLKSLHPLLEDGTEGSNSSDDFSDEFVDRKERVAFIGISNWALDPAKMNRGIMVTRTDPTEDELVFSAREICSNEERDPVRIKMERYFSPLAGAYLYICKKQEREFFGLRDFYSLIKMLYNMCKVSDDHLTWQQLEHAIKRNFGGFQSEELDPFAVFENYLKRDHVIVKCEPPSEAEFNSEVYSGMYPDSSRLGLIRSSLSYTESSWHSENRYVLFLTENYAALDILKTPKYLQLDPLLNEASKTKSDHPFILFGSSFPKDREYTQVCRNINQIKICMETGRTAILLNLENLYESLYDVLNQYYIHHAGSRYVDLGLQTHRVRCRVANEFRLILIAEKKTVYDKFPTPLINRMEKHFVLISSVLKNWQEELLHQLESWINQFSSPGSSKFKESDAFIGFQKDTPASVLFYATNQLRLACAAVKEFYPDLSMVSQEWLDIMNSSRLDSAQYNVEETDFELWKYSILQFSKFLLLQTACPDSIFRVKSTPLRGEYENIQNIYFKEQHHSSIQDFLDHCLSQNNQGSLLLQVTTHSHLLSTSDVKEICDYLNIEGSIFSLLAFDTELDFSNKIRPHFTNRNGQSEKPSLVVIQCDSGHLHGNLIACARYRIYDLMARDHDKITHVLFIIHLPRQLTGTLVGFQGDPWISIHIDDLMPVEMDHAIELDQIIKGVSVSNIFIGADFSEAVFHEVSGEVASIEKANSTSDSGSSNENYLTKEKEECESMDFLTSFYFDEYKGEEVENSDKLENKIEKNDELESNKEETISTDELCTEECHEADLSREAIGYHQKLFRLRSNRKPFYSRLHSCIPPAASKIKDFTTKRSTKRVNLLISLIPTEINWIDDSKFHGILIHHIHNLLQQKEQLIESEKDWILQESLNNKNLMQGRTLSIALSRRVHRAVVHILAEILSAIDRNYNLNLIEPDSSDETICQLWLSIFANSQIVRLKYENFVKGNDSLPGIGARKASHDYEAKFPFSWLVHDVFVGIWEQIKFSGESNTIIMRNQLTESVKETPLGEILMKFDCLKDELFEKYLIDFVHICQVGIDTISMDQNFYKLLSESLDALVKSEDYNTDCGDAATLIGHIATLYVVYHLNHSQIIWYEQLVRYNPSSIVNLGSKEIRNSGEMTLPLCAANGALDSLSLLLEKNPSDINLYPWLQDIHNSINIISTIIWTSPKNSQQNIARAKWQFLKALLLFVEHIMLQHPTVPVFFLRRLHNLLKSNTDFLTSKCLSTIQKHLNNTVKEAKKKNKRCIGATEVSSFERNCRNYFLEIISNLCFGQYVVPEADLIRMLMQIVFVDNQQTRDLTYKADGDKDPKPTIRSALLQLLLEYSFVDAKIYLEEYFSNSEVVLSERKDKYLCLMCLQCFEDALHKKCRDEQDDIQSITKKIQNSYSVICKYERTKFINIEVIEAIASIRFSLQVAASFFSAIDNARILSDNEYQFIEQIKVLCTSKTVNKTDSCLVITGPGIYFIRLLVRIYGYSELLTVSKSFNWVIPEMFSSSGEMGVLDPFIVYNEEGFDYSNIRGDIANAKMAQQVERLQESIKDMDKNETAVFLLAFFKAITMSNAIAAASMDDELNENFDETLRTLKSLTPGMLLVARSFLANQQGGPLLQMKITPDQPLPFRLSTFVVVHTVSVILCHNDNPFLFPFVNMMSNVAALQNSYLPTMSEDPLVEVKKAGGTFYACPNGHPYFVGECGRPVEERSCNICSARIGGVGHALRQDNTAARSHDATQTGHVLGEVYTRSSRGTAERALSSAAVSIIRAIMHSSFIWFACHHSDCVGDLARIVKCSVSPHDLPEFFWMHLQKDLENLSSCIGKNLDEAALLIHLVLKEILKANPPKENRGNINSFKMLDSKAARQSWEEMFCERYIEPVLKDINGLLNVSMKKMVNDASLEQDQLLKAAYETEPVISEDIELDLWTYRQRVSLEHLRFTIQEKTLKKKYSILYHFLQLEPKLRATQYLPHIVKLQQTMYDICNFRLDKADALRLTVGEFLDKIPSSNMRDECHKWMVSLSKAWTLVGHELKNHGRLPVPESVFPQSICGSTLLKYLVPTTTGAGVCTTSLVDFLVGIHNEFVERCHNAMPARSDERYQKLWSKNKVPIAQIHRCHLLDYEHQITAVILSHCHYSLRAGEAHKVKYDYQSLQKNILDKFIYGKPIIVSDIPEVVFRSDIHTTDTFESVRDKVKPQEKIDSQIRKDILNDLRTPDALRANLDIIDTVLGFLSSGGGKPNKPLGNYIEKVLKMKKRSLSRKALEHCKLKHIVSLWEILSVELAKMTWLRAEEPFDYLSETFMDKLSTEEELALDECLRGFDLNKLLGALYEFIQTSARFFSGNELTWTITTVLVQDKYRNLQLPDNFETEFPDTITIAQTVAAWKHIVNYQELNK